MRTSLRRATLLALGPLLTAGLLAAMPSVASAEGGDPLSPESTQSVDVSGVDTDTPPGDAAGIGTAPLPKPDWPDAGVTTEINLSDEFTAGDQDVDARAEDPAEAPEVITVENLGKLPTSSRFGPGAAYTIVPTGEASDSDATTEPTDPVAPAIHDALFGSSAISALWTVTTPTPETPPTPETSPTPSPEPSETPEVPDPGEETPEEPAPDEPYTAPIEVQLSYADFAGAYGGNWASRLHAVLLEDCTTVDEQVTCAKSTPLESTNNTETNTVTAVLPASVYSTGSDNDTNLGPASVEPSTNTGMRRAITATPVATSSTTTLALVAGASGDQGDFSASPLNPNSQWSSGGQSGDFTWSYPLTVPPGAGGPTPDLSIDYSSGSIDGRTSSTNNQTSVIGEGFDLNPGFIERSYGPCQDEIDAGHRGNAPDDVDDLCFRDDNLTISLGGKSNQLIKVSNDNWRLKSDDGTTIAHHANGTDQNGSYGGEYWVATTPDGTQYHFGRHKRFTGDTQPTNSVATVRVFSNNSDEPCYNVIPGGTGFHYSSCMMAWRWSLDYVVDPNDNTMSLYYTKESNYYDVENNGGSPNQYDSAIRLSRIEYGTRQGTENDSPAPAKVSFGYATRCVDAGTDCDSLTEDTAHSWPDVPFDRYCTEFSPECAGRTSPTFFSRYRMNEIHTSVLASSSYTTVNTWDLTQIFPSTGDSTDRALWLRSIKQTGNSDTTETSLPQVSFSAVQMANRVDGLNDARAPFNKIRVRAIRNGVGGVTSIDYSEPECTTTNRPVGSNLDNNIMRCFPVYVARETQPGHEIEFFHKYLVTSVVESDLTGGAPSVPTTYEYVGNPAWRKDMSNLTRGVYRTYSDWRGYLRVRTTVGKTNPTWNETLYLRGMHANPKQDGTTATYVVTDSDSPDITDINPYVGYVRRTTTKVGPNGPKVSTTYNDPWRKKTADNGGDDVASIVRTEATQTTTPLADGSSRVTRTETTHDDQGRPTKVKDLGDMAKADDDRCTTTNYAENLAPTVLIMNTVAETTTTTGSSCAAPDDESDVISSTRNYYDGLALDAPPTRGRLTSVETAKGFSNQILYQTDATNVYDNYGRVIATTDALGNETQIEYTGYARGGDTYGVPTEVRTTDALGQASVQKLSRRWGTPYQTLDIAGRPTDYDYDGLGRVTSIWVPGRTKASGADPSYKYSYSLSASAPNVVTSEVLGTGTDYVKSASFFDGLLRPRETQTPAANPEGGRMITEKRYDSQGRVESARGPYYNEKSVADDIVEAALTELPAYSNTTYDGAGRPISTALMAFGKKKWETKASYGGDRVSLTPPAGGTATTTISDARGRTTSLLQYHGSTPTGNADTTTYSYTDAGQLKTVTTPQDDGKANASKWSYEYDIRGRQIEAKDPDRGLTSTTYDALGRVTSTTDANTKTLFTTYDELGRRTELRDKGDGLNPQNGRLRASWSYLTSGNGIGQLGASTRYETNGDEYSTQYTYDTVGRPQDVTVKVPASVGTLLDRDYTTQMTYYPNGQLKTVDQPSTTGTGVTDENLSYTYDRLGNLYTLTGVGAIVAGTTYTPDGLVTQRALGPTVGKAIYDTRDYNNTTRQLTRQAVSLQTSASTTQMDLRYAYDPAGNVTRVNDIASGDTTGASADSFKQCFDYDYLRRMTQAWTTSSTDCTQPAAANLGTKDPYWDKYTYTKSGNRATWVQVRGVGANAETTTHTSAYPDPSETLNQPHAPTSVASTGSDPGTESFTYDPTGNTTKRTGTSTGDQTITWDEEGHQTSVKNTTTNETTSYIYDADGNRILKKDEADDSTTLYVGNSEYTDKNGVLSLVRCYSVGDQPVAMRTASGGLTLVLADRNNSGQLAINGASLAIEERRFTPFGEVLVEPADVWPNKHGYLDQTTDTSSGTIHLGAREYDPKLGRFLSVDPIGDANDPQQLNGYAYANNSPITMSDPLGLRTTCDDYGAACGQGPKPNDPGFGGDNWIGSGGRLFTDRMIEQEQMVQDAMNPAAAAYNKKRLELAGFGVPIPAWEDIDLPDFSKAAHLILGGCGMLPALGEPCDGLDAGLYLAEGDRKNAAISASNTIPIGGWFTSGSRWYNRGKDATKGKKKSDNLPAACRANSFAGDTPVLMADGTMKPIKEVTLGDKVMATNPETGETGPRKVDDLIRHGGLHAMVGVGLSDGTTIDATDHHPFWVANRGEWVDAIELQPGDEVLASDGRQISIESVGVHFEDLIAYNLTVDELHTYFAGNEPVLVHNSVCKGPADSPVWGDFTPYKGKVRSNGLDGKKREYYTWDYTHNDIEVFNSRGVHMGSLDPTSGELYKPAVKGRTL